MADQSNIFKDRLRLDCTTENNVLRELNAHIEDKSKELVEAGFSEDEATKTATRLLGSPLLISKQIYEVYSQGSWRQAFFAALPHLLIALLFALHCWNSTIWLLSTILTVVIVVIYGWCHGRPTWLFPWLGYCLIPVVSAGILLIYVPGSWAWLAGIVYIPVALFIVISLTKSTMKQDWLFTSLTLLPIPIVLGWMLVIVLGDQFLWYERLHYVAPWIAFSFAVLAITVAAFIRVRQRWVKTGTLLALEMLVLIILALAVKSSVSFWGWLFLMLLSLILILGPALLERKMRQD